MSMEWQEMIAIGSVSLLLVVLSWYYKTHPPKKINEYYGYRTRRSMSNPEIWKAANHHSANRFWEMSWALVVVGVILMVFEPPYPVIIHCGALLLGILFAFLATENYLNKHFDKNGNPK
ncbi:SdpI family protein [Altibacter sp. HG106]|uniref:SdpI family protein n=1 Tax=Altibacter sp. HG106 TaxID=3023937 RepID=UPI002350D3B0|nr:SdpI family protein [Altibacter sp. HG106]MDC7994858.1 SdpI family protein [Altibacter sp. HG106]